MSLRILNQHEQDGYQITEYTKDGITISHTAEVLIQTEPVEPIEPQPSIDERILAENQYQTMLLELTTLGGM